MKQNIYKFSNAHCYALQSKAKYIYNSESQQQQYQFHETNIIRTQKSMSLASVKNIKSTKQNDMKKSNSFLLSNKKQMQMINKASIQQKQRQKQKSKTSKKCLNITQIRKKPPINSKNSMNKTSVSIGSVSGKSIKTITNTNTNTNTKKKKVSNKDYLILDSQIYQCQNIQEINQKLICGNTQIYSHQRFIKATLKNQDKIQNYIYGFKMYISYLAKQNQIKNKVNINQMSQQQKKKLYLLLKQQTKIQKSHNNYNYNYNEKNNKSKIEQNTYKIQNFIKQAYYKIQQKTTQKINKNPYQQNQIRQWKNKKLHQLLEIQSCLKQCQQEIDYSDRRGNRNSQSKSIGETSFQDQYLSLKINKNFGGNQKNSQQNIQTKATLSNESHTKLSYATILPKNKQQQKYQEKYPQNKVKNTQINQAVKYLPDDHYISTLGIQRFLHHLWDFLVDSDLIQELLKNLKNPYGLTPKDKQLLIKQPDFNQYLTLLSFKTKPILDNEIFIKFCKSNQQSLSTLNEQQQKSLIIFQKSIFDCLNRQLTKFAVDFPFGSYHPLQNNYNNSAYAINQENAMIVWDQCIRNIIISNNVGLGSLVDIQSQEINQNGKKNFQKGFKQLLKQDDQFFVWEKCRPIVNRKSLQVLIQQIWKHLIRQTIDQIKYF